MRLYKAPFLWTEDCKKDLLKTSPPNITSSRSWIDLKRSMRSKAINNNISHYSLSFRKHLTQLITKS
jgi:hypothetical protein